MLQCRRLRLSIRTATGQHPQQSARATKLGEAWSVDAPCRQLNITSFLNHLDQVGTGDTLFRPFYAPRVNTTQALPNTLPVHITTRSQQNNTRATYSIDTSPSRPPPYIKAMAQF